MSPWPKRTAEEAALAEGYKSGLEEAIAAFLRDAEIDPKYEAHKLAYEVPARRATYKPDFFLPNGIVIESKGRFVVKDRQKHLLIAKQYPALDLRFVFSNPNTRIRKGSPTKYADWCRKNGFQFSAKLPPIEWLQEPPNEASLEVLREIVDGDT